jgi:hypothetical protein
MYNNVFTTPMLNAMKNDNNKASKKEKKTHKNDGKFHKKSYIDAHRSIVLFLFNIKKNEKEKKSSIIENSI